MQKNKLKNCPFCGGTDFITSSKDCIQCKKCETVATKSIWNTRVNTELDRYKKALGVAKEYLQAIGTYETFSYITRESLSKITEILEKE